MIEKWQTKDIIFETIEFDEIDEFAKNNTISTLKYYKEWKNKIEAFDYARNLRKKVNDFHSSIGQPNFDFLYIDNKWWCFSSIDNFLNIGISQLPDMCNQIWTSTRSGEKFIQGKLYFLPLTKRISVIVAVYG